MSVIENLSWRYAIKKFDRTKKVRLADLEKIKEAIRLTASSYGLQPYKILIIEDAGIRERLKPASWNQPQITDASHLVLFCNFKKIRAEDIDAYLSMKTKVQKLDPESLADFGSFMKSKILGLSAEALEVWTAKQTYIALGTLLIACAEMKIDACPMEGFEKKKYDEILGLTESGLTASVLAAIGYRSDEDPLQFLPKVRKPGELLFKTI